MANVHTVSNQVQATTLNDQDLFLISQTQNSYNSAWKSRKITKHDVADSFASQFRTDNFKEELDALQEVYSEFVDGRELSISYDQSTKKIHLFDNNNVDSTIDASDFIYEGMIESVDFENPYIVIKFKTASGSKTVKIDISKVVVLSAGYGIDINGRTISLKDHQHFLSSIVDLSDLSDTYSLTSHSHDQTYQKIGDYLSSNALDQISSNWQNTYQCVSSMSSEWQKKTAYTAGDGIKIQDNVISLSAKLNTQVTFRDWDEL